MLLKNTIYILLGLVLLVSCGEAVDITDRYNLDKNGSKVPPYVIEGMVTQGKGPHFIRITKPVPINSSEVIYVNDANVVLSDNRGNRESLEFIGDGKYKSNTIEGQNDGRVYFLEVDIRGTQYVANSKMPPTLIPLDSFGISKVEDYPDLSSVSIYTNVHTEFDEYYMLRIYKNDTLFNQPDNIYYADNTQLNGRINGLEVPGWYRKGDEVKIEFYSITKEAFDFYNGLNSQIFSDGGAFGTPPANVQGNIPGALGLFQAAYVHRDSIVVQ